ncbi:MAG: hypothetical protein MJ224_07055 [archaeon]|nr:hypothetical protein [archaeon]
MIKKIIDTKYDIGDLVYFSLDSKIYEGEIKNIEPKISATKTNVFYIVEVTKKEYLDPPAISFVLLLKEENLFEEKGLIE